MVWGKGLVTALAVATLTVGGCAERHFTENLVAANAAQWDSFNQLMLINVLRSRDREPRSYSHFTALRGSASLSPGLSFSIPVGPGAGASNISPSLSASPGISDDVAPLDDQDFYQGILTPVSDKTWALYQDQNWPSDILFHLFVESIKVVNTDFVKMNRAINQVCKSNHADGGAVLDEQIDDQCKARAQRLSILGCDGKSPWRQRVGRRIVINLSNEPDDQCERAQFEAFAFGLMALGFHIEKDPGEQVGPAIPAKSFQKDLDWAFKLKDSDVSVDAVKDGKGRVVAYAFKQSGDYSPHLLNYPRQIALPAMTKPTSKQTLKAKPKDSPEGELSATRTPMLSISALSEIKALNPEDLNIQITTRSADGMIYYLGEVVRAAEEGKPDTVIQTGHGVIPLMKVIPGGGGDPAVSVNFRGSRFSVPRNERSSSMQAFELLKQVFALYNKGSGTPATTAVTVVP